MSFPTRHRRPHAPFLGRNHRHYATHQTTSRHALWYSQVLPGMIPVFLLGSAVYLGLQLVQLKLAHEKFMDDSARQIKELEAQVASLREKRLADTLHPLAPQQTTSSKRRFWWW